MRYILSLLLLSLAPAALASGQRGLELTAESPKAFDEGKLEDAVGYHYIGSTETHHLFLNVLTSTGGGMPYSHLETLKVPVEEETPIENGWTITFPDAYIEAASCPLLSEKGGAFSVGKGEEIRTRCGT